MNRIGTLHESSLHADLKEWYAGPGDRIEVEVDGYHIDLVRADELIEIQTGNFRAIKAKLEKLLGSHRVRLVYPIAQERWINRTDKRGRLLKRRKSPKRGRIEDLFDPLVSIPAIITKPGFTLEILVMQEDVIWQDDGRGSWRRKGWSVADRRLISVVETISLEWPVSYRALLPPDLPNSFTNRDLADALKMRIGLAQKMTYCLSRMNVISCTGRRSRSNLYTIFDRPSS
ncbi:MAG: hypothetical protein WA996_05745 [Candidatus Promineifilaceae bacterium]